MQWTSRRSRADGKANQRTAHAETMYAAEQAEKKGGGHAEAGGRQRQVMTRVYGRSNECGLVHNERSTAGLPAPFSATP